MTAREPEKIVLYRDDNQVDDYNKLTKTEKTLIARFIYTHARLSKYAMRCTLNHDVARRVTGIDLTLDAFQEAMLNAGLRPGYDMFGCWIFAVERFPEPRRCEYALEGKKRLRAKTPEEALRLMRQQIGIKTENEC